MTIEDESLVGILKSAMEEIPEDCKEASEILIKYAEKGFLEESQTNSSLNLLTNELISALKISVTEDEG